MQENRAEAFPPIQAPLISRPSLGVWGFIGRCLRKSFNGWGRASRKEFWSFFLFVLVIVVAAVSYDLYYLDSWKAARAADAYFLTLIPFTLLLFPALFTAGMRRYHDLGHSGWVYTLHMVTGFGTLFALLAAFSKSQPFDNKHGTVPPEAKL